MALTSITISTPRYCLINFFIPNADVSRLSNVYAKYTFESFTVFCNFKKSMYSINANTETLIVVEILVGAREEYRIPICYIALLDISMFHVP